MEKRSSYAWSIIFYVAFLALIVLLRTTDVAPIGPEGTEVGLASLNGSVSEWLLAKGVNTKLYDLSQLLGYLSILAACVIALAGLAQLIRRKSLWKVDRQILALGGLFLLTVVIYVFFEKVVVNCRPVVLPDETGPEPSFPSTHTVLACVIMGACLRILPDYVKQPFLCGALRLVAAAVLVATTALRLFSGCHWITDIIGGILLSAAMLNLYCAVIAGDGGEPADRDGEESGGR